MRRIAMGLVCVAAAWGQAAFAADYAGPLAMVYDGADPDEWGKLEEAQAVLRSVFPG